MPAIPGNEMSGFAPDSGIIGFHLKDNKTVMRNMYRELGVKANVYVSPFACYEIKRGLVAAEAARRQLPFLTNCLHAAPG
jgi:hypothetical protein